MQRTDLKRLMIYWVIATSQKDFDVYTNEIGADSDDEALKEGEKWYKKNFDPCCTRYTYVVTKVISKPD